MAVILGSGEHRYRVVENWARLPEGWEFKDAAAVACDSKDRVYVFNRGEHPMIVFDREGNFLKSWGEGSYPRAHGLHIDANDILYLTDDGGHVVRKCTTEGKVLLELGVPGKPAPFMSGEPFHRCTHTALSPKGEIYVSDGYGNAKVHKYSPEGKRILSWGEPGTDEGQLSEGLITGTPEFRNPQDKPAAPAVTEAVKMEKPQAEKMRVTGEGIEARRITGDDWARNERVTGTEGRSSTARNLTQRGQPRGTQASTQRFRDIERPDAPPSKVTGSSGNTTSGSLITISGGARG